MLLSVASNRFGDTSDDSGANFKLRRGDFGANLKSRSGDFGANLEFLVGEAMGDSGADFELLVSPLSIFLEARLAWRKRALRRCSSFLSIRAASIAASLNSENPPDFFIRRGRLRRFASFSTIGASKFLHRGKRAIYIYIYIDFVETEENRL